jgi:hypothetical protein
VAAADLPKGRGWRNGMIAMPVIFAVMILGMIIAAQFQRTDLVAQDYYDRGIHYQQQIDRMVRRDSLAARVECTYEPAAHHILLRFPPTYPTASITGTVQLFRPSDATQDRTISLAVAADGIQTIDVGALTNGRWKLLIQWQADSLQFYQENDFYRE